MYRPFFYFACNSKFYYQWFEKKWNKSLKMWGTFYVQNYMGCNSMVGEFNTYDKMNHLLKWCFFARTQLYCSVSNWILWSCLWIYVILYLIITCWNKWHWFFHCIQSIFPSVYAESCSLVGDCKIVTCSSGTELHCVDGQCTCTTAATGTGMYMFFLVSLWQWVINKTTESDY